MTFLILAAFLSLEATGEVKCNAGVSDMAGSGNVLSSWETGGDTDSSGSLGREAEPKTWRDLANEELAEKMMKSIAEAYAEKIDSVEYRNGDWAVLMEGKWYYYADFHLLPEELLPLKENYAPQSFYEYFSHLPEWKAYEGETAERLRNVLKDRRDPKKNQPRRDSSFFDTIWSARGHKESYYNIVYISFLGKSVSVHKALAERLAKVEARINRAAKTDPVVRYWINNIGSVGGWSWRNVAGTGNRSFHAYGAALDILPKRYKNLHVYWLWSAEFNDEWYNIPYSRRWHPPDSVVKAFEAHGFCWGGKWQLFDTMHFEYRPEIMLMFDMPFEN